MRHISLLLLFVFSVFVTEKVWCQRSPDPCRVIHRCARMPRMTAEEVSKVAQELRQPNAVLDLSNGAVRVDFQGEHDDKAVSVGVGKGGVNVGVRRPLPKSRPVRRPVPGGREKPPGVSVGVGNGRGKGVSVGAGNRRKGGGVSVNVGPNNPFSYDYAAGDNKTADPSLSVFLLREDLRVGKRLNLQLRNADDAATAYFLPRAVSEAIPFSSEKLSVAMKKLGVEPQAETAEAMKETLAECERPAVVGEKKFCATSLESMVDFARSSLNAQHVEAMVTDDVEKGRRGYAIVGLSWSPRARKSVACHEQNYPYAVFYCHETEGTDTAKVALKREDDGSRLEAVAVCHSDTSAWNPRHVAFKLLKIQPGSAPVCHFLPTNHIVWVPAY
eukprot:TRINITY_DN3167_c0_g1_i1.p1 TRINITY_DN3167_c0_g1~~TRINITY_DN3167_c0_g1_i1.p1  ORF type:complete len:386 (+),score=-14.04 TRINITY_DN3167_c0_g1_i1:53-1210(+)